MEYMLISVRDREIETEQFKTFKEAREEMIKQFYEAMRNDEQLEDGDAVESRTEAYITNGNNHSDYDWKIVSIKKGE